MGEKFSHLALSPVPRSSPGTVTLQAKGQARDCSWAGDLSGCRWIPTVNEDFRDTRRVCIGNGCSRENANRAGGGQKSGHVFRTWHRHTIPAGPGWCPAPLQSGSGFCQWRDRCVRELEDILQQQTNKTSAFLSPCPNRSSLNHCLSCKIPSLAFLIPKLPHACVLHTTSPERERKGPLFPGPCIPGNSLSPSSSHAPRRCVVFSHTVLQQAFFHSTIDGPTQLLFPEIGK